MQIVTFGTMAAKGVIRDVGRVMDLPYAMCDSIAKMIPNELGITISKALKMNPELRGLYESNPEVTKRSTCHCVWRDCRGIRPCMQPVW